MSLNYTGKEVSRLPVKPTSIVTMAVAAAVVWVVGEEAAAAEAGIWDETDMAWQALESVRRRFRPALLDWGVILDQTVVLV